MQVRSEGLRQYREYGLASLILPGLGHLLQGMPFRALLWFGGALILWGFLLALSGSGAGPGETLWLFMTPLTAGYHCASMYAALRARQHQVGVAPPLQTVWDVLPSYLWKQAIGGALAVVGVIVIVLWTGKFADSMWARLHGGWGAWGWRAIGWGELLSQTLLLWGMAAFGGWLFWQGYKEQQTEEPRQRERLLTAQALQNGGAVTVAEASLALNLTLTEARDYMEQLVQQGLAQREEEAGLLRYRLQPPNGSDTRQHP